MPKETIEIKEILVRCWKCKNVINLEALKLCDHQGRTGICPYCNTCLCSHPNFSLGLRFIEVQGSNVHWVTGKQYKLVATK